MSNQSGITADESLLGSFGSLANNESPSNVVVAEISSDNTTVKLCTTLSSVAELKRFAEREDRPLYLFIRDSGRIVFVSYVPERAPVRSKMLYASTKNTVLRQVGSNHISKQLLASLPEELSPEFWSSDASAGPAPLTEAEQVSARISSEQRIESARAGRQLVSQTGGTSHTLSFKIASGEPIPSLLEQHNFVSFKINLEKEQVEVLNTAELSEASKVPENLSQSHPTYSIYKNNGKLHFIYSCPSGSKVKERMLYASNKSGFVKHLREVDHLTMETVVEIGDADELETSQLEKSSPAALEHGNPVPGQLKFNRPKRPGRRT
ncbi:LAQU0S04e06260g1_1 [Lachancea quebecensis]|uniref:LAQU0S04e06260g1_1 n=1 Tax=Lachancea quebecensis TaxID=1654605 RepID=A0A0P1KQX6_9SACH|nr:LAQU0S04e06260g1_1 [Lachancea quebecensis]